MPTCSECKMRDATHPYNLCQVCFINPTVRSAYRHGKGVREQLKQQKPDKKPEVVKC